MSQKIITIGREYGSGGHIVARLVAEHYGISLYDRKLLEEISKEGGFSAEVMKKFDEHPVNVAFVPIPIGGSNISIEQEVAIKQFNFLREKAETEKESFVVIGRCADEILGGNKNTCRVFVLADDDFKINRVMKTDELSRDAAADKIKKINKSRKTYHNFYCDSKWGDSRGYDICINTAKISFEQAAKLVIDYVDSMNSDE